MSNQELKIKVQELQRVAQGNDAQTLAALRAIAIPLHSQLPAYSPFVGRLEDVLVITKSKQHTVSQSLFLARDLLSTLHRDLSVASALMAEKPVERDEDGYIVFA